MVSALGDRFDISKAAISQAHGLRLLSEIIKPLPSIPSSSAAKAYLYHKPTSAIPVPVTHAKLADVTVHGKASNQ